jgi:hypothetical protein
VLQSIFSPLFFSAHFYPFSPLTSPPSLPLPTFHSTTSPSSILTTHWILYQPCTPPSLCYPWHKHHPLQLNYTLTCTTALKSYSSQTSCSPSLHSSILPSSSTTFLNYSSISIQTTITLPIPTVYRQYHKGVLYILCKQLVWHWICEFLTANLHLHTRDRNNTSIYITTKWVTTQY